MNLEEWIARARSCGASDLHLESGQPPMVRVRGNLTPTGNPLSGEAIAAMARAVAGARWARFAERRSLDLSRTLCGVRCRINAFQTSRGVALAIRLLAATQPTLARLNLHPELAELVAPSHGLIILSGPTGSGKSSTLAGLVQEINTTQTRHILTLERPIEYALRSRRSFIRQREVGRDTPSFSRGLVDALREDPDVLVVGEMRTPRTMRLTLAAAETGHLVLTTMHSSSCAEALHRLVGSFSSQVQAAVRAQLADCLVAVVSQRLTFREDVGLRVPECEVLRASTAARTLIRGGQFFKLPQSIETQRLEGMWSFRRYRAWLDQKQDWHTELDAEVEAAAFEAEEPDPVVQIDALPPPAPNRRPRQRPPRPTAEPPHPAPAAQGEDDIIEIEPTDESIGDILRELDDR